LYNFCTQILYSCVLSACTSTWYSGPCVNRLFLKVNFPRKVEFQEGTFLEILMIKSFHACRKLAHDTTAGNHHDTRPCSASAPWTLGIRFSQIWKTTLRSARSLRPFAANAVVPAVRMRSKDRSWHMQKQNLISKIALLTEIVCRARRGDGQRVCTPAPWPHRTHMKLLPGPWPLAW